MKNSVCFVFGLLMLSLTCASSAGAKPNIVVILTDDQGWGDLSVNGNANLQTPHIDSLARDGASFDRFYVCPVCSPTRAEFLTGRYHPRSGVHSTSSGGERLDLDERTVADTFRAAGYATGAFGKWHNGMQYPYHPNGRGFDEFYGFCSGHWGDYFSPPLEHNGEIVQGEGFVIDDFTGKALAFIERHKDKAFFAYLPYNTPHSPMQVPERFWEKFAVKELAMRNREPEKEDLGHTRAALAMCENIDWNVGRVLDKLDSLGIADNTIVAFFCDNGPNGIRWNGDMKGRKGSTDEGGVRSPMLIRWPEKIAPGTVVTEIGAAIDLLPTLADLAGIPLASRLPLDGISLKPVLTGGMAGDDLKNRLLFSHWNGRVSVATGSYRLDHQGELFNLAEDPGQRTGIAAAMPQLAERLRQEVAAWKNEVLAESEEDRRPFLIGHPDFRFTQLPARDGVAHGNIERSNRFPNCSFFRNWTSIDDKITWEVEVLESGDFAVEMGYACARENTGAVLELSLDGARISQKITLAHDPPLRGGEHDRVKRVESYVKDFKIIPLGVIHLEKGRGTLTLRATEIPGKEAIEFRLLMLKRV